MKARDTIMKLADYSVAYSPSEVEVKLEAQAEISFEVGKEAALKEVGEWLVRKRDMMCDSDFNFHIKIHRDSFDRLLQGKMPEEKR